MVKNLNEKVIAITRPIERSKEAISLVEAYGGVPLVVPTLELKIACTDSLMDLCKNASALDWLIFTSPAAVESIFKFCPQIKDNINSDCKIAVIGPKTRLILEEKGLTVDMMPTDYTAEGLLESFKSYDLWGKNIGIPRTLAARKVLPDGLEERGAQVFIAEAYESVIPKDKSSMRNLINKILSEEVAAITFTSPLTVENLFNVAQDKKKQLIDTLSQKKVITAAIGPITGKTLAKYGIDPVTPDHYTVEHMMRELFAYLGTSVN